jgi:hypothetical protein
MKTEKLHLTLTHLLNLLVDGRYTELAALGGDRSMPAEEIGRVLKKWSKSIQMPPAEKIPSLVYGKVLPVAGKSPREWHVHVRLWSSQEGFSKLTLVVTIINSPDPLYGVVIEDVQVT